MSDIGDQIEAGSCGPEWANQPPLKESREIERLRKFRDRVLATMTEHAGGQADFAYIWQSDWDKIKAECGEPVERKDGGK